MTVTTGNTLGQIAAENPRAVPVFEKHGIDYCCGGDRSMEEACREKGISAEKLLAEIEAAPAEEEERDWERASLAELADHIVARHHGYLRQELPALTGWIQKVLAAHRANHANSLVPLQQTFAKLNAELSAHMMKEEMVLFPLIKRMEAAAQAGVALPQAPGGSVQNPIRMMEYEHDDAAAALGVMRSVTSGYTVPPDGCATYRALFDHLQALEGDLHVHIHLENNILFPRAAQLEQERLSRAD